MSISQRISTRVSSDLSLRSTVLFGAVTRRARARQDHPIDRSIEAALLVLFPTLRRRQRRFSIHRMFTDIASVLSVAIATEHSACVCKLRLVVKDR